jgi:hypothetical protein
MMVIYGSLRLFWHLRSILPGVAGRWNVWEIQVALQCEAKWV